MRLTIILFGIVQLWTATAAGSAQHEDQKTPDDQTRHTEMGEEDNMALVTFDARDGVIQRAAEEYNGVRNRRCFPIETGLSKHAWNASGSSHGISGPECVYCRHHHCRICDECSAPKQYSDYWICHQCGELNRRASN